MSKPPIGSTVSVVNPVTGEPHEGVVTEHLSAQFVFTDEHGFERIWCDTSPYTVENKQHD